MGNKYMKKTRKSHLWIGLIASILILMESVTGLLMNEPWLIGQSQVEGRGGFQQGQFPGSNSSSSQMNGQFQGQNGQSQSQNSGQTSSTPSSQGQMASSGSNGQFPGPGGGFGGIGRDGNSSGSLMSIIKGLHEGRIGTTDVKWLIDLAALAMIFLTGSGIFLSLKVLGGDRKKKKRQTEKLAV